mmetsp:Transcript_31931/g.51127  ORF Transcript_31931/g.51127 Transcript_31931/m.51127 type:complete len:132 (-) Transcript_31931:304-699(-)
MEAAFDFQKSEESRPENAFLVKESTGGHDKTIDGIPGGKDLRINVAFYPGSILIVKDGRAMAWVTAMHVAGDKRPDIIRLKTLHDIVGNYKLKSIRNGNTPDDQGQWRDWERLKKTYNSEITAWAKVRLPK